MTDETAPSAPWTLWAIGGLGLLFNLMGCANFLAQLDAASVASMPESYRAIIEGRPAWATAGFALAVFGGAGGAILLLLRKAAAAPVLVASVVGALVAQLPLFGMPEFPTGAAVGGFMQVVVGIFLAWYAGNAER